VDGRAYNPASPGVVVQSGVFDYDGKQIALDEGELK